MEYGRSLSECKSSSSSYWLAILILAVLVVPQAWGGCLEEERKALLQIKASLDTTYGPVGNVLLPTWVNHSSRGNCCDWERVTCDNTSGRVTELNLSNIRQISYEDYINKIWPLNVSLFLHFKELTSLDLSWDFLDNGIEKTGLAKLSSLKKLTVLDLSSNELENNSIFSSLGAISSLKILDVSDNSLGGRFPAHELAALENLEVLDLTYGEFHGSFRVQGFEIHSKFLKLETLNLGYNDFNESLIASLSALPSLKVLNLEGNPIISFPTEDLANLRNLERLDLSASVSEGTLTVQGCKSLSRLTRLHNIALGGNVFNKSIISCLSALPSLKILNLRGSDFGSSFPTQELSALKELTMLDVSKSDLDSLESSGTMYKLEHLILDYNNFNKDIRWSRAAFPSLRFLSLSYCNMKGVFSAEELPNLEVLILSVNQLNGLQGSFHRLEVLDLSQNSFVGSIPSSIQSLSSLKALSLAGNELNGSLHSQGLCELKNLQELDLSNNTFEGNLPPCLSSLSSLKLFDLSSNQFSGKLPPSLISNLTSLEYVDLSHNKFEGSFSFSLFSNHTKLEVVEFIGDNDKFEIETEEPSGWIPTFQLKVLVLSNCNLNSSVPSFLLHQNGLRVLDLSHNSLHGWFPNWLIENNTALELFNARNNSFGGSIHMPPYRNVNLWWLDMSGNQISGSIPADIGKNLPYITHLNLTGNALNGSLPLSIGDLSELEVLDLSNNNFTGEVPRRLVTSIPQLQILKLSNNRFEGEVLSRKFDMNLLNLLMLDKNRFTGGLSSEITNNNLFTGGLNRLDISDNSFSGVIPRWMSNLTTLNTLVLRNNKFEGQFPCGIATFRFLDISQNFFSGSLPSCPNLKYVEHLHLEGNRFTGSIPKIFHDLPYVLTLDLGNNNLSGEIPGFLGELHSLRILLLRGNNFSGQFPNQLCQLNKVSIIDISSNNLSGSIPSCLRNITGPIELAFKEEVTSIFPRHSFFHYRSILQKDFGLHDNDYTYKIQDEVQFITKRRFDTFTGGILDYMSGLDLSCNNLTGEIPEELGLLTHIHALNLSHNHLTGPIPWHFSNLKNIESLDLSWNALSGKVPSEFIDLGFLAVFSVAHNNLSGRLPEMKGQFGTFSQDSYEANPFLCGPPLEKKCTLVPNQVLETPSEDEEKWYDIDMLYFYASFASTWFVFLLGFAGLLYINPYWLRRWLYFIEECIYSCYYFLCDSMRKLFHARP